MNSSAQTQTTVAPQPAHQTLPAGEPTAQDARRAASSPVGGTGRLTPAEDGVKRNRALGLFAVLFFVIHACAQLQAGRPENLLWACHVADLTVGIGLLFAWPRLAGAAVLMLLVGVPLWLIDLTAGSPLYPTSLLTHLGGLTVGLWGLGPLGVRERGWLLGVAMVAVLLVASYAFTPAQANVNLIYRGWGPFNSHFATPSMHVLQLLALWSLGLWLAQCFLGWTHDLKRLVTRRQMAAR